MKLLSYLLAIVGYFLIMFSNISFAQTSDVACTFPPISQSNLRTFGAIKSLSIGGPLMSTINKNLDEQSFMNLNEFDYAVSPVFMSRIQYARNSFYFNTMDTDIAYAKEHNLKLKGDSLVYGLISINPPWLNFSVTSNGTTIENPTCGNWSKSELDSIMKNHIQQVVGHGGTNYSIWEVVNEPFDGQGNLYRCWYKILGREYIANAFRYADAARPNKNIKLMLNEHFGWDASLVNDKPKIDAFFKLVGELKAQSVPLDVLGIQLHLNMDVLSPKYLDEFKYYMNKAKSYNLPVHITEMDVYQGTNPPSNWQQIQKSVYKNIVSTCLSYSNCTSFSTWGISDKYSWLKDFPTFPSAKPLLFDSNFSRKSAYYGVIEALTENTTRMCKSNSHIAGDLNFDNKVNYQDYLKFLSGYGKSYTIYDFNKVASNW